MENKNKNKKNNSSNSLVFGHWPQTKMDQVRRQSSFDSNSRNDFSSRTRLTRRVGGSRLTSCSPAATSATRSAASGSAQRRAANTSRVFRTGTLRLSSMFKRQVRDSRIFFSQYLALDITANCICKIHCLAHMGLISILFPNQAVMKINLGRARIQTRGCWAGSKNASSVLHSPSNLGS